MLTEPQAALFDDWKMFVESWVEKRYTIGELKDYQSALSDALLALQRAAATYDGGGTFRGYLEILLRRAMIDLGRRERRYRHIQLPDPDGNERVGLDADSLIAGDTDRGVPCQQEGAYRDRSRRPRRRFRGGWSEVFQEVIRREAAEMFNRGWREGMRYCGYSEDEIDAAERREKRARQQRARRQRQRVAG